MTTKKLLLMAHLFLGSLLLFGVLAITAPKAQAQARPPVPAGCPGTPQATEAPYPDVCSTIPPSCPGATKSSLDGNPQEPCPYEYASGPGGILPDDSTLVCESANCDRITDSIIELTNFLAVIVGVVVTGSIIWGGIQYTAAADNPQQLSAAKVRIRNAIIALLAFIFLYTFLQWLVPGGVL